MILCLETATNICSVAISNKGKEIANETISDGQRHSSQLAVLVEKCLKTAGITKQDLLAVAISNGPGSYTGLRVGASMAKGLCYGLEIPLITVSSLHCMASAHLSKDYSVMATIDARRMEAYTAVYYKGEEIEIVSSRIWTVDEFDRLTKAYPRLNICGDGIAKAIGQIEIPSSIMISPNAANATLMCDLAYRKLQLGDFSDIAYHSPHYYKSPNITTPRRSQQIK